MTHHDTSAGVPAAQAPQPPPRPSSRRASSRHARPHIVMPGLVPGISIGAIAAAETDARNKSTAVRFNHRVKANGCRPGFSGAHGPSRLFPFHHARTPLSVMPGPVPGMTRRGSGRRALIRVPIRWNPLKSCCIQAMRPVRKIQTGQPWNKSGRDGAGKRKGCADLRSREGGHDKNMTFHDIPARVPAAHAPRPPRRPSSRRVRGMTKQPPEALQLDLHSAVGNHAVSGPLRRSRIAADASAECRRRKQH